MKKTINILLALATAFSASAGMSNSLELTQLYIIGGATPYSWDLGAAPEMRRIAPGVFQWQGTLRGGEEFKFMNTRECWHKHIVATESDAQTSVGGNYQLDFYANWQLPSDKDLKFKAPEAGGEYLVTVDLNSMLMNLSEAPEALRMPERLYATGTALGGEFVELPAYGGVEFKAGVELAPGNLILTDRAELTEDTRVFGPMFEDVDLGFGERMQAGLVESAAGEAGWSVGVGGKYTLYASFDGLSGYGRRFRPKATLYIVGGCCELSWNYWDPSDCRFTPSADAPEELVWEGRLEIGRNGNTTEPEKFKILTAQDWFAETYHPYSADAPAEGRGSFRTTGGDDHKWAISSNGVYRITVNTWKETISVECEPDGPKQAQNATTGVKNVLAAESGSAAYYDLRGMRLSAPRSGTVCIEVRTDGSARKMRF